MPIVGRTAERVLLSEQLAAMESGRGNVVIIGGEAGIGKTTVARDLARLASARGYQTFVGHSYDLMAAPPYGLWLDLTDGYQQTPHPPEMPPAPPVLANRSLESVTTQAGLFAEVTTFLQAIGNVRPVVIVLEDVHWADPASLELLRHVSPRLRYQPILIVVTYRVDELTRQNPFYLQLPTLIRESEGLRLDLKRLGTADLDALVMMHYNLSPADRKRLVRYLDDHAEGNPFFAMELLRALEGQDHGGLIRIGDSWSLDELDRIVVPALVRQVIDARVARLGEATRLPLTTAAVIGHEIPIDLLASVAGIPEADLYAVIDTAIDWHLFTATPDGGGVQFVHALTREALYESSPPHRRRALHRAVAEALEALPQVDADAVAYHYQQAGDPRAPEWLTRAGERAQRAYAWLTSRDRFAAAADLLESVPGEEQARARLLYRCGRLQRYASATTAIDSLRAASRLAEQAGDLLLAADATYSQGLVQCFADDWTNGLPNMIDGIEKLRALPPPLRYIPWSTASWMADALPTIAIRSSAGDNTPGESLVAIDANRHMSLAWFLAHGGRVKEALDVADRYRHVEPSWQIGPLATANAGHAAFGLGVALATLGQQESACEAFERARQAYLPIDHHACIAFTFLTQLIDVMIPFRTDDIAGRQRIADQAGLAIDRARGAFATSITPAYARLSLMMLDGRWDDARAIVAETSQFGSYILRRQVTQALAPIARHRGDPDEAWSHIHRILPDGPSSAPGTAVVHDAVMLQQLAADLHLDSGELDDAKRWLDANDRWLTWSSSVPGRAGNALGWARYAEDSGDAEAAGEHAERAVKAASQPYQPLALIQALRFRGQLAHRSNNTAGAEQDLVASVQLATTCGVVFERSLSLEALAHARAMTAPAEAWKLAQESLAIARELGAKPHIERVESFLASLAFVQDEQGLRLGGLTARELDVLRLVAQGMTDAEVADQLFISPRTVGQHLRSVYGKLDVRSRTEATRFAMQHGFV